MRVFIPQPFRSTIDGKDYTYGFKDVDQSTADRHINLGLMIDPDAAVGRSPKVGGLTRYPDFGASLTLTDAIRASFKSNPLINPLYTGATVSMNASASVTATQSFDDTAAPGTYMSHQGSDFYAWTSSAHGFLTLGAITTDGAPSGSYPFSRSNVGPGVHWFYTESPEIDIYIGASGLPATTRLRVLIDEGNGLQHVDYYGVAAWCQPPAAGNNYLNIAFNDTRPRRRLIGVEHAFDVKFGVVSVRPNYTITPGPSRPVLALQGDSTVACTVQDIASPYNNLAVWQTVLRDMGGIDVRGEGIGGTGWVAPGSYVPFTSPARMAQLAAIPGAQATVVPCSTNDSGQTSAALQAAFSTWYAFMRAAKGPKHPLIILGMYGGGQVSNSSHVQVETAIGQAVQAAAANDQFLVWLPHLTSTTQAPVNPNLTLASLSYFHCTMAGYLLQGQRITRDVYAALKNLGL